MEIKPWSWSRINPHEGYGRADTKVKKFLSELTRSKWDKWVRPTILNKISWIMIMLQP